MKILFCGDVVGRSGRDAVIEHLPRIKNLLHPDLVILNGENAAHGFGITRGICDDFYKAGVDIITLGNHAFDNKEIMKSLDSDHRLVRPINYPAKTPGRGFTFFDLPNGKKIMIVNAMARLFMDPLDDPFAAIDDLLSKYPMGGSIYGIFLDFHGEASSEKMAMGHYLDGKVSAVVGTHTHIPTADTQIFPHGTGYQTDAGMCGDYNSVIGMDKIVPIQRFRKKIPTDRMQPASGPGTFCGTFIELNEKGLCTHIEPVRCGPRLMATH
ncbi:MAG: YmdB family metallophosphoesterase [Alphaproteobacteria bacterium]|nr:YmdB family metallophosphoesterase [Alphaproteobacteria bacterium]